MTKGYVWQYIPHMKRTLTRTPTKSYIKYLPAYKVKRLKARVRRLGLPYSAIAEECQPQVTYDMVFKVVNGIKVSRNVMGAIARLEAEKIAGEADVDGGRDGKRG